MEIEDFHLLRLFFEAQFIFTNQIKYQLKQCFRDECEADGLAAGCCFDFGNNHIVRKSGHRFAVQLQHMVSHLHASLVCKALYDGNRVSSYIMRLHNVTWGCTLKMKAGPEPRIVKPRKSVAATRRKVHSLSSLIEGSDLMCSS